MDAVEVLFREFEGLVRDPDYEPLILAGTAQLVQQKIGQILQFGRDVLQADVLQARTLYGDVLLVVIRVLRVLVKTHEVEGSCLPFLKCYTVISIVLDHFVANIGNANGGQGGAKIDAVVFVQETDVISSDAVNSGTRNASISPAGLSLGEWLLAEQASDFDYVLREVAFSFSEEGSLERQHATFTCQVMWRVLVSCVGISVLDGSVFLELCGNEVFFPVALSKVLLSLEPDIGIVLSDLWNASKNLAGAERVAAAQEGATGLFLLDDNGERNLQNAETGKTNDIMEFRKQVACAFVDDDILSEMIRGFIVHTSAFLSQPEIEPWKEAMNAHSAGGSMEVFFNAQNLANLPPPSPTAQRAAHYSILFLTALSRCLHELCAVVDSPYYADWGERYKNLFKRIRRHVVMHCKGFIDYGVREHLVGKDATLSVTRIPAVLRTFILAQQYNGLMQQTGGGPINGDQIQNLSNQALRLSYLLLGGLTSAKRIDPSTVEMLQKSSNCLIPLPQKIGLDNHFDIITGGYCGRLAVLCLPPQGYEIALSADGQPSHTDDIDRGTNSIIALLKRMATHPPSQDVIAVAFWRAVKKWFLEFYAAKNYPLKAEVWENFDVGSSGLLSGMVGITAGLSPNPREFNSNGLGGGATNHTWEFKREPLPLFDELRDPNPGRTVNSYTGPNSNPGSNENTPKNNPAPDTNGATTNGVSGQPPGNGTAGFDMIGNANNVPGGYIPGANTQPQNLQNIPEHFRCCIDGKIMRQPVRFVSSHNRTCVYEFDTLRYWLSMNDNTCPITGEQINMELLHAEHALQAEIDRFVRAGNAGVPAA